MGKKTEDEILSEFLDTFEAHFATLVIYIYIYVYLAWTSKQGQND